MASSKKKGKGAAEAETTLLGRPGNNVKMGIVGMPNVGKSTLFNILSDQVVPAENYPFCTIDPHTAKVAVPDKRFRYLCKHWKPKSEVEASLTVVDIAGLVKGASEGAGLGNAFLSNISAVDGIFHVVRAFKDKTVEHVEGDVDPVRDLEIISEELLKKDIEAMEKKVNGMVRTAQATRDKKVKDEFACLEKVLDWLKSGKDVRAGTWNGKEIEVINTLLLLTAKPVIYLVNVSRKNWEKGQNKWLAAIKTWVDDRAKGSLMIPFCARYENEVHEQKDKEAKDAYIKDKGLPSRITKIIHQGYAALQLIHFFTAGEPEVKCWTIRKGTKAKQAAGVIHSDMEHGFICAETMAYKDFKEHKSAEAVKAAGKFKTEGRDYVVKDGDIFHFKFNAPQGGKKNK